MNINLLSIARDRTASKRDLPNNPHRAPRTIIGFCTPHVGPLRAMQNVNQTGATTWKPRSANALGQNSKAPECQTISPQEPTSHMRKTSDSASGPCCAEPGGRVLRSTHFPDES